MIYEIAINTNKDPSCVQITKYKDACIALLLGLTKYTIKKEGINSSS